MTASGQTYTAYGLGIRSELPLPELMPSQVPAEIAVVCDAINQGGGRAAGAWSGRWVNAQETHFEWPRVGRCLVRRGREILLDPVPEADDALLRRWVLGPALATLLMQRGILVLHASTVLIADRAVAFLGGHGAGKSTLVAAMRARGHRPMADDVTAVDLAPATPAVIPGIPQLKLWPETLRALGFDPEAWPRVLPTVEKRAVPLEAVPHGSVPLAQIFVVTEGPAIAVEPLASQAAVTTLVAHTYGVQAIGVGDPAAHIRQCARVVDQVRVVRLRHPRTFETLPEVVRVIERRLSTGRA